MNCYQCNSEAVLNSANHKEFYYCRTCKSEVFSDPLDDPRIMAELEAFQNEGNKEPISDKELQELLNLTRDGSNPPYDYDDFAHPLDFHDLSEFDQIQSRIKLSSMSALLHGVNSQYNEYEEDIAIWEAWKALAGDVS